MKRLLNKFSSRKGFTLIELIVVIAVLGVLAAVLLAIINPVEQLKRGRDAGRISEINQVGKAWQSWYTAVGSSTGYPGTATGWEATNLIATKDLGAQTTTPANTVACTATNIDIAATNKMCYSQIGASAPYTDFVVWVNLESDTEKNKASCGAGTTQTAAVFFGSKPTVQLDCLATATTVPALADTFYNP